MILAKKINDYWRLSIMGEETDKSNQLKKIVQADADLRNEIAKTEGFDPRKKNKAITQM